MPKVSIIMPLYNKEIYVRNAIESVLCQTFSDFELIIVDDGSTDNSFNIVQDYTKKDNRIVLIKKENGGVSEARNVGLSHAKGEWIQFLDADDQIDLNYLTKAQKYIDENEVDILFSDFWIVDEEKNRIRNISSNVEGSVNQTQLCNMYVTLQEQNGFFGYISNKLFRRSILLKSGARFSKAIKLAEDLDFYAQLYPYIKRALFKSICSFYYVQSNENYIYNNHINYLSQLQVQMDIRKWFQDSGTYKEHKIYLDKKVADYIFFSLFYAFEEKKDCSEEYKILQENSEVMSCIDLSRQAGFQKRILALMLQHNRSGINFLLSGRRKIREIYRSIKGYDTNIFVQSWRK